MDQLARSRGLDERESEGVDAAYAETLRRLYGEVEVAQARERWRDALRAAQASVRRRPRDG